VSEVNKSKPIADPEAWVKSCHFSGLSRFVEHHIAFCLAKDKHQITTSLKRLKPSFTSKELSKEDAQKLEQKILVLLAKIERSSQQLYHRKQHLPTITYPDLPVSARKDDILNAIKENQVVIIAGETGSGKTTQLPKICLEAGLGVKGLIAHTQPRRLAARSVASRIAEELNTPLGEKVGFKIRFSDQVSDQTYIKLMTDGMLLAEMQQDRFLNAYDTIIIDEAHERSLNIDFLLGYLKRLLPKRPELKVIITSATIDPERFSQHFFDAPIIEVSGRTYPVEIRYHEQADDNESDQIDNIITAVDELMLEPKGDILVFLSGERDIRDTQHALEKQQYRHTDIVPLFARLSASEQNKIFQSHTGRRIVLATNVAETSLTVPGIKYVIDPGMARISRYSTRLKVQRLPIEPISQASANQRAGRCGRVSNGICIRLYSEQDYQSRPLFTDPEILRTHLASVILQMMALGLGDINQFPFVQPPDSRNISDGFRLLDELQATEMKQGRVSLSEMGRQLSRLPVDPRFARMIIESEKNNALFEVIVIASGLSIQDPRERPQDKKQKADEAHQQFSDKQSDFIALLKLWGAFKEQQNALTNNQLRKWCKAHFVNYLRMREWQDIVSQVKKSLPNIQLGVRANNDQSEEAKFQAIHQSLLAGLLSHIGMKDKEGHYLGARNSQFLLFPASYLAKKPPKWVMSAELVETSRLFARVNASIDPAWVEPLAKHMTKSSYSEPHWSKKRGAVMAYEKVMLLGIPIVAKRSVNYSSIDKALCQELFIRDALVNGDTKLNISVLKENQMLLAEAEAIEQKTRQRDWLVSEDVLLSFYQSRLPEHVVSEASFLKWWKHSAKQDSLRFTEQDVFQKSPTQGVANAFPETWQQGRLHLHVHYEFEPNAENDGVTIQVPLPILNQLSSDGFDWSVPGLRQEKVTALIKSLPKRLRKNFVPAPQFAEAALSDMKMVNKQGKPISLVDALTEKLFRMTGVKIAFEDWQVETLPKHLITHFSIVDEQSKQLAFGNDLTLLQQKMRGQVQQTFEQAVTPELERKGLTSWDFDSLPETFVQHHGGFEVKAFPALQKKGNSVDIVLLDSEEQAKKAHVEGVVTLLRLAMPSPVKYLQEKLPNKSKLGLYFNPFGKIQALIDDCIIAAIYALVERYENKGLDKGGHNLRDKHTFKAVEEYVRGRLNDETLEIALEVEKGLTLAHKIQKQMKGNVPLTLIQPIGNIKAHLDSLVFPGFVSFIGKNKLKDWCRYLTALEKRLEKAKIDPQRDKLNQMSLDKIDDVVTRVNSKLAENQFERLQQQVRWMTEELRVSLFAQQLGTSYPISEKRIMHFIEENSV
jgi:ATP-dependent helicase HrpA